VKHRKHDGFSVALCFPHYNLRRLHEALKTVKGSKSNSSDRMGGGGGGKGAVQLNPQPEPPGRR
jgi:hypothetical protein